jgi:hypothetical protein
VTVLSQQASFSTVKKGKGAVRAQGCLGCSLGSGSRRFLVTDQLSKFILVQTLIFTTLGRGSGLRRIDSTQILGNLSHVVLDGELKSSLAASVMQDVSSG